MIISIKKSYIFWLSIYLLALPTGAMNIGAFGSLLKILSVLPIGFALLSIKHFRQNKPIELYLLYFVVALTSCFYSINVHDSRSKSATFFLLFILLASSLCFEYNSTEISRLKNALIWSSRISVLVVLIFGTYNNGRLWLSNGIIDEDPNYFCMYLSYGVISCVQNLMEKNSGLKKFESIFELAIYLIICLLTGSRGGLLALIFGALIYLIFNGQKEFDLKTIFIIAFVAIVLNVALNNASDIIQGRFSVSNVLETGGSSRTILWAQGIDLFEKSSPFRKMFGYGISTTMTAFSMFGYLKINVLHNMFLESLIEIGIVGLLVYLIMIKSFMQNAFRYKDKFGFGVIICMIIMSLTTSISSFKPYLNIMLFILVCTRHVEDEL